MRPNLVVELPPGFNLFLGISDMSKPVFIEALVPQFAVETFDKGIVRRLPGTDMLQLNAFFSCPLMEEGAGKFRPVVHPKPLRIAVEKSQPVDESGHPSSGYRRPHQNARGKTGKIIHNRQNPQPPAPGTGIGEKIHGPDLMGPCCRRHLHPEERDAPPPSLSSKGKTLLPVNALGPLMVHNQRFSSQ